MARAPLPPGFRFHPTDVELIMYYLKRKVLGKKLHVEAIAEVNIYKFSPWDLPDKSCLKTKDQEWFFFCPREKKYGSGDRMKRGTENGFWKTTGKERPVLYNDKVAGTVKTLVFHLGHAPKGKRTDWVIHEYRILDEQLAAAGVQDTYVLCKVFEKKGPGPKIGVHYGAPFDEAEWEDDTEIFDNTVTSEAQSSALILPADQCHPDLPNMVIPGNVSTTPLIKAGPSSSAGPSAGEVDVDESDAEILHLLAAFTDDEGLLCYEHANCEKKDEPSDKGKNKCPDENNIYLGLDDLDTGTYIELNDLLVPLSHSAAVNGSQQLQLDDLFGPPSQAIFDQSRSQDEFSGSHQYASAVCPRPVLREYDLGFHGLASSITPLPLLPEGCNIQGNCPVVLPMVNGACYHGYDPARLDCACMQPVDTGSFSWDVVGGGFDGVQ